MHFMKAPATDTFATPFSETMTESQGVERGADGGLQEG